MISDEPARHLSNARNSPVKVEQNPTRIDLKNPQNDSCMIVLFVVGSQEQNLACLRTLQ
jgi:hypothetical protein